MNISYNWLKQYIDLDISAERLAEILTSVGLETGSVEEVESIKGGLRGLVIGKVLTCVEHLDSDHLHVTTVDLGADSPVQIVCGAPNVAAGQTVVVATVGTTLYSGDESFKIKKSKIRGVESLGMICAEDEIGVGSSHDGIIVIDREVAPGTPAAEYFGLESDYVLEVDLTPNRIDAASHFGVARDLSAWMKTHATPAGLNLPDVSSFKSDKSTGAIAVEVEDTEGCIRYCGLTIRGVKVAESPEWLRNRLTAVGLRPINNIVDITNYILLGLGQPMHCFDLAKVKGDKIVVKTVESGTPFTTLDGVERKIDAADVMICNAEAPMCIAGVFGGLDSGVTSETTDIFLESACFHPTRVRKTARRHGLNTDASFRFERGVDPNLAGYAMKVAAMLVKELAGGEICGDIADIYPAPVFPYPVELTYDYINGLIGKDIPEDTVNSILESLEMDIRKVENGKISLLVPTYRVDVRRPCDVVEDLLRIYGYNNVEINDRVHSSLSYKSFYDLVSELSNNIANQLTAEGFNEILNNSLTASEYYADNELLPLEGCVKLLNPLSSELNVMRRTLLYGGLETIAHNINRRENNLRLYEFGNVYHCNPEAVSAEGNPLKPYSEESRLALWVTGLWNVANWTGTAVEATIYNLRAVVDNMIARLGIPSREIRYTQHQADSRYAAWLAIDSKNGKRLGEMGILSKAVLKKFDIKQDLFYAEFDMHALVNMALKRNVTFEPLPRTHPVKRDLALLISSGTSMAEIEKVIRESEKQLLKSVELFDVYTDQAHLPVGKKSYAVSLTLQDSERTLNDKQIDAVMAKIVGNLGKRLNAELR